jgi:hypothetical protein
MAQIPPARRPPTSATMSTILRMVRIAGGRWSLANGVYVKVGRDERCRTTPDRRPSAALRRGGSVWARGQLRVAVDPGAEISSLPKGGVVGRPPRRPVKNEGIWPEVTHQTTPAARATVSDRIITVSTGRV